MDNYEVIFAGDETSAVRVTLPAKDHNDAADRARKESETTTRLLSVHRLVPYEMPLVADSEGNLPAV